MIEYIIIKRNLHIEVFKYGLKERRKTQEAAGGHHMAL